VKVAPYSGAPFHLHGGHGTLPSWAEDGANAQMSVYRRGSAGASFDADQRGPEACNMGDQADGKACLGVKGRGCMWTRVETRDPLKRVQASNSYCLPCRMEGQEIPCWSVGGWVGGKQVTHCSMSCAHQQKIVQPEYACSDDSGFITQSQCFDKAARSGSKCMFIAYEDEAGEKHSSCGPCKLQGSGGWGCPAAGQAGPAQGSKVVSCLSQCDVLCSGPPACPPTVAPPPPPPPPSPGVVRVSSPQHDMVNAPAPFDLPTANPYAVIQAARDAAERAGYRVATTAAPKVYWPVVYYVNPIVHMFTTGPPPLLEEPPLPEGASLSQTMRQPARVPLLRQSQASSLRQLGPKRRDPSEESLKDEQKNDKIIAKSVQMSESFSPDVTMEFKPELPNEIGGVWDFDAAVNSEDGGGTFATPSSPDPLVMPVGLMSVRAEVYH